jgi:DNA polymerase-3 subunit epsilon
MAGPGFAVIDFETTGLFPGGHDRVIEVAVVHTDVHGHVTGQWETLINPGRDLGRQDIHRVRAADVLNAPTFAEVAAELIDLLSGRVLVAHNASFDTRFLLAELARLGCTPESELPGLCTMQLAREFLPGAGRSLADCCSAYDIDLQGAHRASVDAFATARLLEAYIQDAPTWNGWAEQLDAAGRSPWPALMAQRGVWQPRPDTGSVHALTSADFIERITLKLPEYGGPAEYLDYLALLDRCLLDRSLSAHESNALVGLAEELGLDRNTCVALHLEYFESLARVAWADGILTADEIADLAAVGRILDIPATALTDALQQPSASRHAEQAGAEPAAAGGPPTVDIPRFVLESGDRIVLTGEMTRGRDDWHHELTARGYLPAPAVTKKVKLVVAADPDSLSGKARKARDYGIPVVSEQGLVQLLGV